MKTYAEVTKDFLEWSQAPYKAPGISIVIHGDRCASLIIRRIPIMFRDPVSSVILYPPLTELSPALSRVVSEALWELRGSTPAAKPGCLREILSNYRYRATFIDKIMGLS